MKFNFFTILLLFFTSCSFDTSGLKIASTNNISSSCGNNVVDTDEVCDGEVINNDCVSMGFVSGVLGCNSCQFDTSQCHLFCGECEIGSFKCLNNKIFQCINTGTDCGEWQESQNCSDTNSYCQINNITPECSTSCNDQCTQNETICSTDLASVEKCTIFNLNEDAGCLMWQTITNCDQGDSCIPIDGVSTCVENCVNECNEGEEICDPATNSRKICTKNENDCYLWSEISCPEDTTCVENVGSTECSCVTCTEGDLICSDDLSNIEICNNYGSNCTKFEVQTTCDSGLNQFCSTSGGTPHCDLSGDTCNNLFSIDDLTTPFQIHLTDFDQNFHDSFTFNDASCGATIGNSPDIGFEVNLTAGQSLRILKSSGFDVNIKILRACDQSAICLDTKDNDLSFTAFETGTYIIVIEQKGVPAVHEINLMFAITSNICTVFESETNNSFTESDPFPGSDSFTYCSQIRPAQDVDCVDINVDDYNALLEITTSDIYDGGFCPGDTHLTLYNSAGTIITTNDNANGSTQCSAILPHDSNVVLELEPDSYKVCIAHGTSTGIIEAVATNVDIITAPHWFENTDLDSTCPPTDWTGSPILGDSESWYCLTDGSQLMRVNSSGAGAIGTWDLYSPRWDMSLYSHVILSFDQMLDGYYDVLSGSCEAQILLEYSGQPPYVYWSSTDNITTLTNKTFDLSGEIAGKSDVKITFRFNDSTSVINGYWEVDNIKVVGY